jgi:peptidoglycan/LPS O-acetylase OafA/YrhL
MGEAAVKYCPELDGLRCLSATAVILLHSRPKGPFQGGYIGVDVFFVLSGFLITSLLAAEYRQSGRINLPRFYWKRIVRLMPALLLMLAAYLVIAPLLWPGYAHARDALLAAIYFSDFTLTFSNAPKYLGHTWSLAVEEQFYLLWPLLLVPLLRSSSPVRLLVWIFVGLTIWRGLFAGTWQAYFFRPDTHGTGLVAGAALAFALPKLKPKPFWAVAGALTIVALGFFSSKQWTWATITLAEVAAVLIIAAVMAGNAGTVGTVLRRGILVRGGKISYAVYLWHYPFVCFVRTKWDFMPTALATLLFSFSMAVISNHTAEAYGRRLRRQTRWGSNSMQSG